MADIKGLLVQAAEITKNKIAVIMKSENIVYPENSCFDITFEEACKKAGKNYKGWNIYLSGTQGMKFFFCISSDKYYESEATRLVILLLDSVLDREASSGAFLKKAAEGKYDAVELAKLEEKLKACFPGYMLLVDNLGDSSSEILEILINTMDVKVCAVHEDRIIAVAVDENMAEACSSFVKNVLSELLIECKAVIGGKAVSAKELHKLYANCIEALCLKQIYRLGDNVLDYDGMYGYRIAYNLDPELKEAIKGRVLTPEFMEMANGELGITIEEFFKNNLNLTDTAAKLYIHRNTLLYRLDKIHKCTGYDLKKFEDSWLFKLAWMIYKEDASLAHQVTRR
ncbi:MAG TPA: helix-turn-helix domain-containing protein [Clostridia bacterium]|nr:helix-turn-helix domain-containing protein [Clostridia bacterium]